MRHSAHRRTFRDCWILGLLVGGLVALGQAGCDSLTDSAGDSSGKGASASDSPPVTDAAEPSTPQPIAAASARQPGDAKQLLRQMAEAYRAASTYTDQGVVRLTATIDKRPIDHEAKSAVAFARPNKLRLDFEQANLVLNGQRLRATVEALPGQVLDRPAPEKLTVPSLYRERMLGAALSQGFGGPPWRLMLLLGDPAFDEMLGQADLRLLDEKAIIGKQSCHQVEFTQPEGSFVLLIDEQSHALRRIVYPTDSLREMLAQQGTVEDASLIVDFDGAELGADVPAEAFIFDIPTGAKLVKFFVQPHPAQLLGNSVPPFEFTDREGNTVTPESIAGKVTVLDFWATWCGPCRESLPKLEEVYRQHQGKQVATFAVSVDDPGTRDREVQQTLDKLGVSVPLLRDPNQHAGSLFYTVNIPSMILIDANGVVQDYEIGANPQLTTLLPKKLERLLAGEDIYQEPLREYQQQLAEYERAMEQAEQPRGPDDPSVQEVPLPETQIAPRGEPSAMKLTPLWESTELDAPGNILAVEQEEGPLRLLVVDAWKAVAELGPDGKVVARHDLPIEESEFINSLRTAPGADGRRRYLAVGLAARQQRCHLLDEQFQRIVSYPENALEHNHAGIADARLADLDGDGTLEIVVGYWGEVGVQAASPRGERIWSNRSIPNVQCLALTEPDADGKRAMLCANMSDTLAQVDAAGRLHGQVRVPGRPWIWIAGADLASDGTRQWCGISASEPGQSVAVGINMQGEELWDYPLPSGIPQHPVEQVQAVRLSTDGPGQWLLAGADGSIHILDADGTPRDRFNYGKVITGVVVAELHGQPALLVSSPEAIEAFRVEWK